MSTLNIVQEFLSFTLGLLSQTLLQTHMLIQVVIVIFTLDGHAFGVLAFNKIVQGPCLSVGEL
jgi:hypothetical protein